jgi:metallo-beta-lactamase family protein
MVPAKCAFFGEEIPMRTSVHTISGFSAHADQAQLLAWHAKTGNPARTFLVHGEADVMRGFAERLKNTEVVMSALHQSFEL